MQVVLEGEADGTEHLQAVLRGRRAAVAANALAASVVHSGSDNQLSPITAAAA